MTALVSLLAVLSLPALLPPPALHADGPFLRDAAGGVVILRGVNVGGDAKVPPFVLPPARALDPLPALGLNVVRLLFIWEAFEPRPGAYDLGYLEAYRNVIRAAAARGLYTIVDFHQDAMSRFTLDGCGEGFPQWAVPKVLPLRPPDNGWRCASWTLKAAFDGELATFWHAFYQSPARAAYIAMVARVAQRLTGTAGIVGYDVINEPWGDEVNEIAPLQAEAGAAIRALDPKAVLFLSPHVTTSGGLQSALPPPTLDNVVYAPHFYDSWVMGMSTYIGNTLTWSFSRMRAKAAAWNVPLFVGEFGAPATVRRVGAYMQTVTDRLNEAFLSGAQWCLSPGWSPEGKDGWNDEDLSIIDDRGALRPNFVARPYPQRIAGMPQRLYVGDADGLTPPTLELAWEHDPAAGDTIVFWPFRPGASAPELPRVEAAGEGLLCAAQPGQVRCRAPRRGPMTVRIGAAADTAAHLSKDLPDAAAPARGAAAP